MKNEQLEILGTRLNKVALSLTAYATEVNKFDKVLCTKLTKLADIVYCESESILESVLKEQKENRINSILDNINLRKV